MHSQQKIRMVGLGLTGAGVGLGVASTALVLAGVLGIELTVVAAAFMFVSPAMFLVGLIMLASPGPAGHSDADFGEWLEMLPWPRRAMFYGAGAVGFAIGGLLLYVVFKEWWDRFMADP